MADNATISGSAIVSGYAVVFGSANVSGNARIEDHAMVGFNATVNSNAVIEQYAFVPAYTGEAVTITRTAMPWCGAWRRRRAERFRETAIVDYDYTSDFTLSNGVNDYNHPYDEPWNVYYARKRRPSPMA